MVWAIARISLVTVAVMGVAGMASARDASAPRKGHSTALNGFRPAFKSDSRVSGTAQPYTWPVSERYRPVSQPYFGRAY